MSWVDKIFNFFGLHIEKIQSKCSFCNASLSSDPAKVVVNNGHELLVCETCEKILELSNAAVKKGRTPVKDDDDGDEPLS